ncbi:MAG: histidine phosphatase family protein [bacterium]|nr:histidine phosphatase family protein [bacterium]
MSQRILYLVRHGQYNLRQHDQGELTPLGEAQSHCTAQALQDLPFGTMHVSTVRRAVQTAEIIAQALPGISLVPTDRLRECVPSMPRHLAALFTMRLPQYNPEEMSQCTDQFEDAFQHFFRPPLNGANVHDLIVCHGNIIRYFVTAALKLPGESWTSLMINNCGITRILVDSDGEMFLMSYNDIGHLPLDMRTDN